MAILESPIVLDAPAITIRSIVPGDAHAYVSFLLDITRQSENLTFEPDETEMFSDETSFLESIADAKNSLAIMALDGERIVGSLTFLGGKRSKSVHAGEFGISVDVSNWGRGIGKALMTTMVRWAASAQITKITLQVRTDNRRAIALYESFGFTVEGTLRHAMHIGASYVDLLCMGLCLGDELQGEGITEAHADRIVLQDPPLIRPLRASDAPAVLSFVDLIVRETPFLEMGSEGLGLSLLEEKAILADHALSERKLYIGSFTSEGRLVGILACSSSDRRRIAHTCEFSVMVLDAFRSQGIAGTLLDHMITWAQAVGFHRIALHVHAENRRAIALYERFGFVAEARILRTFIQNGRYYDSIAMSRLLEA